MIDHNIFFLRCSLSDDCLEKDLYLIFCFDLTCLLPPNAVTRSAWEMWTGLPHPTFLQRTGSKVGSTNFFYTTAKGPCQCALLWQPHLWRPAMVGCLCFCDLLATLYNISYHIISYHIMSYTWLASQISEACQRSKLDQRPTCFFLGGFTTEVEGGEGHQWINVMRVHDAWSCYVQMAWSRLAVGTVSFQGYWSMDFSLIG